jgi:hypothetical protein
LLVTVMINPYDTSGCPPTGQCAACGAETRHRRRTVECFLGVFCLDLCEACFRGEKLPRMSMHSAIEMTRSHEHHLGVSREEIIAACKPSSLPARPAQSGNELHEKFSIADEAFYHHAHQRCR